MENSSSFCLYCICFAEKQDEDLSSNGLLVTIKNEVPKRVWQHEEKQSHKIAIYLYNEEKHKLFNGKDSYVLTYSPKTKQNIEVASYIIKVVGHAVRQFF